MPPDYFSASRCRGTSTPSPSPTLACAPRYAVPQTDNLFVQHQLPHSLSSADGDVTVAGCGAACAASALCRAFVVVHARGSCVLLSSLGERLPADEATYAYAKRDSSPYCTFSPTATPTAAPRTSNPTTAAPSASPHTSSPTASPVTASPTASPSPAPTPAPADDRDTDSGDASGDDPLPEPTAPPTPPTEPAGTLPGVVIGDTTVASTVPAITSTAPSPSPTPAPTVTYVPVPCTVRRSAESRVGEILLLAPDQPAGCVVDGQNITVPDRSSCTATCGSPLSGEPIELVCDGGTLTVTSMVAMMR